MGILEIFFAILILVFPLGEVFRIQQGSISLTLNDAILSVTVLVWIIKRLSSKGKFNKSPTLAKPIGIFLVIGFISLLVNSRFLDTESFFVSFLYLVRFGLYALIYFVIFDLSSFFKKKILYLLTFSSVLVMLIGYIQFIFYPNLRNLYYLGWDEHLYRLFSTLLDPNFAGTVLVLSFLLLLGLSFNFFKNNKRNMFLFLLTLSIINLYEIYLTYSRSAIAMLVVSLIFFLLLLGKKKLILSALVILILIILIIPKSFQTEGTNLLRIASVNARLDSINNSIGIIKDNPILGVGFNAYRYAQHRYGFLDGGAWKTTHAGAGTDNSFLFVLATTGLIGFISFIYLLFSIFKVAIKKRNKMVSIILISSLAGLIINSMFINSLFYIFIMEWIWILAGVTENN